MYLIEKKFEGVQKNIQVYIVILGIMDVLSRHGVIWIGDTFFLLNQKTKNKTLFFFSSQTGEHRNPKQQLGPHFNSQENSC